MFDLLSNKGLFYSSDLKKIDSISEKTLWIKELCTGYTVVTL